MRHTNCTPYGIYIDIIVIHFFTHTYRGISLSSSLYRGASRLGCSAIGCITPLRVWILVLAFLSSPLSLRRRRRRGEEREMAKRAANWLKAFFLCTSFLLLNPKTLYKRGGGEGASREQAAVAKEI
jgi:hypothetical protein